MKTLPVWLRRFLVILAIGLVGYGTSVISSPRPASQKGSVEVTREATATATMVSETAVMVTYVFDGDTIGLSDGTRVRYIGVNTPKIAHDGNKEECFAREATVENTRLVLGKTIRLVRDASDTDVYGRLLRYVYVGDQFINDVLVREGFARTELIKPDIGLATQLLDAQNEAQMRHRGIWVACK